jgi:hypothetical protein
LTRASWDDVLDAPVAEWLRQAADVTVHVIDVGVERPNNTSVVDLRLSAASLTPGSPLQVDVRLGRAGEAEEATAQLFLEPATAARPIVVNGQLQTPPTTLRDRQTVNLPADGEQTAKFALAALPLGTHHGYVELLAADGLEVDNRQYFTVHVRAPWSVLVVNSADSESYYLTESLAPSEFREQGRAKFACTVVTADKLADQRLADFAVVALLDPPPLSEAVWQQLLRYVQRGGGLALFMGRNARSAAEFNAVGALAVLPAPIERRWRDPNGVSLAPRDYDQPLLSVMREIRTTVPWDEMPIFEHWVVETPQENGRSLIDYSNGKPAVLERLLGRGRVLLMTTPISDPDVPRRPPWNLLPTSLDPWPFLILLDRMFLTLVQTQDATLNYLVGQPAQLPVASQTAERYSLFTPSGSWLDLTSSHGQVQIPFTEVPGTYRLNVDASSTQPRGFSVNLSPASSRLERISDEQLESSLGPGRFQLAKTEAEVVREIDQTRVGQEFYPFLLPLLVVILALEYVTANRFYPAAGAATSQ